MSKKKKYNPLIVLLIIFSIYCSLTIGQSLDEEYYLILGKNTLDYLLSLGNVNNDIAYGEYFSTTYWSLLYAVTEIFPSKYTTEITHLVSLYFSLATIFGIGKVCSELFNKKVGKIVFLLLFFYPIFFGHMSINNKDTILAFSHVWIVYLIAASGVSLFCWKFSGKMHDGWLRQVVRLTVLIILFVHFSFFVCFNFYCF